MGLLDFFRKKKASQTKRNPEVKDDFLKIMLEQIRQKTLSEHFASGAIFDITRQRHSDFEQIVRSNDSLALLGFFSNAYRLFCNNPQIVGLTPAMVDINKNDTDPKNWNTDIFISTEGEAIALCYMPIQHDELAARMIGIVLGDEGDRYYYCMLNKDMNALSDVMQNKAMLGVEKVGEVKGRGFNLMNSFLDTMKP